MLLVNGRLPAPKREVASPAVNEDDRLFACAVTFVMDFRAVEFRIGSDHGRSKKSGRQEEGTHSPSIRPLEKIGCRSIVCRSRPLRLFLGNRTPPGAR